MIITDEIKTAIKKAIQAAGSRSELSRVSNVGQQNFSRYINGQVPMISDRVWRDLYPFIKPYLPEEVQKEMKVSGVNNAFGYGSIAVGNADSITYSIAANQVRDELLTQIMSFDFLDAETKIKIYNELKAKGKNASN